MFQFLGRRYRPKVLTPNPQIVNPVIDDGINGKGPIVTVFYHQVGTAVGIDALVCGADGTRKAIYCSNLNGVVIGGLYFKGTVNPSSQLHSLRPFLQWSDTIAGGRYNLTRELIGNLVTQELRVLGQGVNVILVWEAY